MDFKSIIDAYKNCDCEIKHECNVNYFAVEKNLLNKTGKVLTEQGFNKNILVVSDKQILKNYSEIIVNLECNGFTVSTHIFDNMTFVQLSDVTQIESVIKNNNVQSVLAVGGGSVVDCCKLACTKTNTKLAIFITALSTDSYLLDSVKVFDNATIATLNVNLPKVVLCDLTLLSNCPLFLKKRGVGVLISKYLALIDLRVTNAVLNTYYCEKVDALIRYCVDTALSLGKEILSNDVGCCDQFITSLLLCSISAGFVKNSDVIYGADQMLFEYLQNNEYIQGLFKGYNGELSTVCTLYTYKIYGTLASVGAVKTHAEQRDLQKIEQSLKVINKTISGIDNGFITDKIDLEKLLVSWDDIRSIIKDFPTYDKINDYANSLGLQDDFSQVGVEDKMIFEGYTNSCYLQNRLTLRRIVNLIDVINK